MKKMPWPPELKYTVSGPCIAAIDHAGDVLDVVGLENAPFGETERRAWAMAKAAELHPAANLLKGLALQGELLLMMTEEEILRWSVGLDETGS